METPSAWRPKGREMRLHTTFEKIARSFSAEFEELAGEIAHPQQSGEAREHALTKLLGKYLPLRVGVDRGFVIDVHGATSCQMDIVIYDRTVGTVFEISGVKYFPCESVIAVGEVKTGISSRRELRDALEKVRSAKALDRTSGGRSLPVTGPGYSIQQMNFDPLTEYRDQILGFMFTSGSMTIDSLLDEWRAFAKTHDRRVWPNLYCDFNRFIVSYTGKSGLTPSPMEASHIYCTTEHERHRLLLTFYCILAHFVDIAHVARLDYFRYANIDRTNVTAHEILCEEAGDSATGRGE